MNFEIQHIEVRVSSFERAREFYVYKIGLEMME
jgi:catechol 2,3-dioxygenase-like lactoylglutathione lyase family enzyme